MDIKNLPESEGEQLNHTLESQKESVASDGSGWVINALIIAALILLWIFVSLPKSHGRSFDALPLAFTLEYPAPTPGADKPVATPAISPAPTALTMIVMSGKIVDENGRPLVGATVILKGSSKGTSTDSNGNYTLEVPADTDNTLIFGYGGYDDEIVRSRGSQPVNVTLTPRAKVSKRRR
jgi:hypothetical protein